MTDALYARSRRAVQVVTPGGRVIEAGRACLLVLELIGWHPLLVWIARRRPFIWGVKFGYRLVAGQRDRFGHLILRGEDEWGAIRD